MTTPQIPITYYGDAPSSIEAGQRYASHPHELVAPAVIRGFALESQVTEGTMDTINGSADVGLVIDGAIFAVTTPANAAALISGLNAIPAMQVLGVVTNPSGSTLRVTFNDYESHTVTAYSPGTPDITGITNTTEASDPQFIPYGCALIKDPDGSAAAGCAAVLPATEYDPDNGFVFGGLLARANGDRHSDEQVRMLGYVQGVTEGLAPSLHADCVEIGLFKCALGSGVGAATKFKPAYFETASGPNCGKWYTSAGGTSQVTRGDVAFNGTDLVGLTVDGVTYSVPSNTSDDQTATDLRDYWNSHPVASLIATASIDLSGSESYIILSFLDTAVHTVVAYSPATADVTGITNTTTADPATKVAAPGVRWGRGHKAGASVGYLEIGVHP